MRCDNLPIQVIVHYTAAGAMQPLRFQFEDQRKLAHTVRIDQVMDSREVEAPDSEVILYRCRSGDHWYELKYLVRFHKWILFRQIC